MVAHRMVFFIRPMLHKNTARINLAGLGRAVGFFALASGQLLGSHGHTGTIGADIHEGRVAPAWLGFPLLPHWRVLAWPTRRICRTDTGMAPVSDRCRSAFWQPTSSAPSKTDQPGQSGRVADLPAQRRIGGIASLFLCPHGRRHRAPAERCPANRRPADTPVLCAAGRMRADKRHSTRSSVGWSRHCTSALAGLKRAVRASTSHCDKACESPGWN